MASTIGAVACIAICITTPIFILFMTRRKKIKGNCSCITSYSNNYAANANINKENIDENPAYGQLQGILAISKFAMPLISFSGTTC